jgi:hypothetical protein
LYDFLRQLPIFGMMYMTAVNSSGEATAATMVTPPPPTHLHLVTYLQRHTLSSSIFILSTLSSPRRRGTTYAFSLQDLYLNVVDITDVFMVSSRQLFRIGFAAAEHYQYDYRFLLDVIIAIIAISRLSLSISLE